MAMVARYFEHYKYIYSPRSLYEIEIKKEKKKKNTITKKTLIPKCRRQVDHADQCVRMLRAQHPASKSAKAATISSHLLLEPFKTDLRPRKVREYIFTASSVLFTTVYRTARFL